MGTAREHDAAEAGAALELIADSRRASAQATRRRWWTDLGLAGTVGAAVTLGLLGHWLAALVVWLGGAVGFAIVQRRLARRRGQVVDQRAWGSRAWRFALVYGVLFLLTQFQPPVAWLPWYAVGAGVVTAVAGFAWLRWEDRYQAGRLAAGDFDRYDLL